MSVYKIDKDGNIWEYDASAWKWTGPLIGNPPTVVKARALAGGQLLHRLDEDGSIWQYSWHSHTGTQTRSQIYKDPNTRAIAGGMYGRLYQLQGDGRILALNDPLGAFFWQEIDNDPLTRTIAAGAALIPGIPDPLYKIRRDGSLCVYSEDYGWRPWIDSPGGTIAIAQVFDALYKLQSDGSIWVWVGASWVPIHPPSNVRSIAIGADPPGLALYFLDSDGVIAQYIGPPWAANWQQLEKDPAAIAIAVDYEFTGSPSQLYRLNNDGRILSYQPPIVGSPHPLRLDTSSFSSALDWGWVEIDHNPDTISIVAVTIPSLAL